MLILSRKIEESIVIGDNIEVSIVDIKGDQVKLGIKAPKDVKVYRREVFTAIQNENKAAAKTGTRLPEIEFLSSAGSEVPGAKNESKNESKAGRPSANQSETGSKTDSPNSKSGESSTKAESSGSGESSTKE